MPKQTKHIGLSDKQRKDAINRSLSGLRIGAHAQHRTGRKRPKLIEQFSIAFTRAAS